MDERLLKLCLREFLSVDDCIAANPYGRNRIIAYIITDPLEIFDSGSNRILRPIQRELRPYRLPNGLWSWLPHGNEDLAKVAEVRRNDGHVTVKILYDKMMRNVHPSSAKQEKEQIKTYLKRNLMNSFQELTIDDGRVYRIAFEITEKPVERYGIPTIELHGRLFYCG